MVSGGAGYQKLFEAMKSLGQPTKDMLDSLIAMGCSQDQEKEDEHRTVIRNVEPIAHLIEWLPTIEDQELQYETATKINQISASSLQR